MSRYLVVYASHFGQTRKIADRIADTIRARGHIAEVADVVACKVPPPVQDYDVLVAGSRVELGRHDGVLVEYLRESRQALAFMPWAFFSVSAAASTPNAGADPNGYMEVLFSDLGSRPTRAKAFAGGLPYRKYNFILRFIMKRVSRSAGHTTDTSRNHEMTNWDDVRAFAEDLATLSPLRRPDPRMMA